MELHDRPVPFEDDPWVRPELEELPPPDTYDPVVDAFTKDVDRTLLIENLKLTPAQRAEKFEDFMNFVHEVQKAGRKLRGEE